MTGCCFIFSAFNVRARFCYRTFTNFISYRWRRCIQDPTAKKEDEQEEEEEETEQPSELFFTHIRQRADDGFDTPSDVVEFPAPKDININMMPFILSPSFTSSKLPQYLKPYWPLVQMCCLPEVFKKGEFLG